jgi:hypothetical protein
MFETEKQVEQSKYMNFMEHHQFTNLQIFHVYLNLSIQSIEKLIAHW